MAFDEKDTTRQIKVESKGRTFTVTRDDRLPGAPVRIMVEYMEGGASIVRRLPQHIVDKEWPKGRAWVLSIIGTDWENLPPAPDERIPAPVTRVIPLVKKEEYEETLLTRIRSWFGRMYRKLLFWQ